MKWWIYKCNSTNKRFHGDWRNFFAKEPKDKTWGNTETIPELDQLKKNHRILAYQTDRNELVGICRMLRRSGKKKKESIHLKWIKAIRRKVRPLKKGDRRIARIQALQPGPIKTLYHISPADAKRLLKAADTSQFGQIAHPINPNIQSERARMEGEKRTVETTVRDPRLRADAKVKWGLKCYCCGFEFARFYGDIASNLAIVHHLKMFKGKRRRATVQDVRVVCANCHQVIHVHAKPIHVDNLKKRINRRWTRWSDDGIKSKARTNVRQQV